MALHDNVIIEQTKLIASEHDIIFVAKKFNFSSKWLGRFKPANSIPRIRLHGEGTDADMDSIHVTRR